MVQRVAVIGAGPSGLTSIKCCLDEMLEPTCFESSNDIGGLWRFKETPEPGKANIYQSVVINSSKEMMSYSDFPPPAELPNNMHHSEVMLYLRLYAQEFQLMQHIRFQTTVVSVRQRADFAVTGQWDVDTESAAGQRETHIFDAVLVCSGHYTQPHLPLSDFPGIEGFKGRYLHSWEYRNSKGLEGKRVLVIGTGNSGSDIAVDISRAAERVYLSTRRGAWVIGRVGLGGLPGDIVWSSRMQSMMRNLFPNWSTRAVENKLNEAFDHKLYGLKPKHSFWAQIPIVNDDLAGRIISGRVQVKPNVKEFLGTSVVFADGSIINEVDTVIFATGYNYSFPFLPPKIQTKCGYRLRLYKHIFPPLTRPTLAVVGFIHGFGAVNPLAEMQARWATRVFKGTVKSSLFMDVKMNPTQRLVDYLPYMDSLAEKVGVKPNVLKLFLRDPKLALEVFLGPCTPYQYRLSGPGQWTGARQAILTQWQRVTQPFRTRVVPEPESRTACGLRSLAALTGAALLVSHSWYYIHVHLCFTCLKTVRLDSSSIACLFFHR
uniref:Flavin-containing monooxygenase n=1 Tax=Oryzias latipes TaxID=8090 RepID=A0A3P9JM91_ORYLA